MVPARRFVSVVDVVDLVLGRECDVPAVWKVEDWMTMWRCTETKVLQGGGGGGTVGRAGTEGIGHGVIVVGFHQVSTAQWLLGVDWPLRVSGAGRRWALLLLLVVWATVTERGKTWLVLKPFKSMFKRSLQHDIQGICVYGFLCVVIYAVSGLGLYWNCASHEYECMQSYTVNARCSITAGMHKFLNERSYNWLYLIPQQYMKYCKQFSMEKTTFYEESQDGLHVFVSTATCTQVEHSFNCKIEWKCYNTSK